MKKMANKIDFLRESLKSAVLTQPEENAVCGGTVYILSPTGHLLESYESSRDQMFIRSTDGCVLSCTNDFEHGTISFSSSTPYYDEKHQRWVEPTTFEINDPLAATQIFMTMASVTNVEWLAMISANPSMKHTLTTSHYNDIVYPDNSDGFVADQQMHNHFFTDYPSDEDCKTVLPEQSSNLIYNPSLNAWIAYDSNGSTITAGQPY